MRRNSFLKGAAGLWRLAAAAILLAACAAGARAQVASNDLENPTPMTSGVVTGKSNGKAKTVYYSFTATAAEPGEVKVRVSANTDERSTNLRVNFFDEDGQKLMDEIYLIPTRDGALKVARHTFADRRKVVMRVTLPEDPQVGLLTYKIDVSGAVEFEGAPAAAGPNATAEGSAAAATAGQAAEPAAAQAEAQTGDAAAGGQPQAKQSTKQKIKEGAKKTARGALKDLLKDNLF